jgi:drug/metabolite transporter (DMT)-like permease
MQIALALASALLFALGTVLQQKAGSSAPSAGARSGLLLRLARRPVWLAGIASDGLGFVAQAAALRDGRLDVVQPLLITSVVFALPLGIRLGGQRVHRSDLAAAALVVVALAGFLVVADPAGGRQEAPLRGWLVAAAVCAVACAPLALVGRRGPPPRRAALLGAAAGVLFALSAALTKATVDELNRGIGHVALSWEPYALAAVGYVSMTFNQLALDTGALAATVATSAALDPIASVVLGLVLFHESLHATVPQAAGELLAVAAALTGMTVLARSEAHLTSGKGNERRLSRGHVSRRSCGSRAGPLRPPRRRRHRRRGGGAGARGGSRRPPASRSGSGRPARAR